MLADDLKVLRKFIESKKDNEQAINALYGVESFIGSMEGRCPECGSTSFIKRSYTTKACTNCGHKVRFA